MKLYSLALCAVLGVASQAQAAGLFSRSGADERLKSGWEIGAALGMHDYSEKDSTTPDFVFDTSTTAYKLFAGYRFNRYFTVEAGYVDGGSGTETYVDAALVPVLRVEQDSRGYQGSVLGSLPLGQSALSLFGRVGYFSWKADTTFVDPVEPVTTLQRVSTDGSDLFLGGGLMAALDGAIIRLEYEYVDYDTDVSSYSATSKITSLSVAWIF